MATTLELLAQHNNLTLSEAQEVMDLADAKKLSLADALEAFKGGATGDDSGGETELKKLSTSLANKDLDELSQLDSFKNASKEEQDLISKVFGVISTNDLGEAERLEAALEGAGQLSSPFFKQQTRIARDALERGFTAIDQEEDFRERQLSTNLRDLREDIKSRKEFLGLEEASQLRGIERQFDQTLLNTRQNLAAKGKTFSSERIQKEGLLEETTGDLRETTERRFGIQQEQADATLLRSSRDTQREIDRLSELAQSQRTDLFRTAEQQLGTEGLGPLSGSAGGDIKPLKDITGDIPRAETRDVLSTTQNLIF